MEPRTRRLLLSALTVTAVITISACGAMVAENETDSGPVSVNRCGQKVEYTKPQRTIAYEAGSADKLFELGLDDHLLGYAMTPTNPDPKTSPYADHYEKSTLLSEDLLNKELVVDKKADLVVAGWNSGFSEERGITPEILDDLGIQSFMHSETCYNYPSYPEKMTPFEGLYTDFERLGAIFGVEDRASEVVSDLRSRMDSVEQQSRKIEDSPDVFVYGSGTDQASTVGNQVPAHEIIEAAGGHNVFGDLDERYTTVGWESVVEKNPEIIMIMSYRDKPAEEKIADLKSNPALKEVPAIKNDRFFTIDYNECISGPRNVDGAEKFVKWLSKYA